MGKSHVISVVLHASHNDDDGRWALEVTGTVHLETPGD